MKIDFHVHTHYSIDSIIKPKELAQKAKKTGIIPCITEHNNLDSHSELKANGLTFIPSEEIRTDRGDLIGLFLNECIKKYTHFEEAIDIIHSQGGLAYLPHMYDKTRKGVIPTSNEAKKLDIIEIFNARCPFNSMNLEAEKFADIFGLLKGLGSDSHFLFEFGQNYVEVPDFDLMNPKELLDSLKAAKFNKSKAPFFVRGSTTLVAMTKKLIQKLRK